MKIQTEQIINELSELTQHHLSYARSLQSSSPELLNFKPSAEQWSTLECLEHLNRYGLFYLPEIERSIKNAVKTDSSSYKSGWLGNYFANSMLPKERLNKMKTFKNMNPSGSDLGTEVITEFIRQQEQLLRLLENARNTHLGKIRTSISISKLIRLKLGDTFRFYTYHIVRHIEQVKRTLPSS